MREHSIIVLNGMGVANRIWKLLYFKRFRECGLEPYLLEYEAEWLTNAPSIQWLAQRCLERIKGDLGFEPILLGFSAGALIAQEIAKGVGDALAGLVLISPFAQPLAMQKVSLSAERQASSTGINNDLLALLDVLQVSSRDELFDDEIFTRRFAATKARDRSDPTAMALFAAVQSYTTDFDSLSAIVCPTQVIAFSDDLLVPSPTSLKVANAIPTSQFVSIYGAGHAGLVSHSQPLLHHLELFLSRLKLRSTRVDDLRNATRHGNAP